MLFTFNMKHKNFLVEARNIKAIKSKSIEKSKLQTLNYNYARVHKKLEPSF